MQNYSTSATTSCPRGKSYDSQTFSFPLDNQNPDDQDKFTVVDTINDATVQYPFARVNPCLPKKEIICIGRRKSSYDMNIAS